MSLLSVVLISAAVTLAALAAAAVVGRKLLSDALRKSELRSLERLRGVEARLAEQIRQNEAQMRAQAVQTGKEARDGRRAEDNLIEVAKGLTSASIEFSEKLKAIERRTI